MADQEDDPPAKPGTPGIVVTPAEESPVNEVTKSSENLLQASHDVEDEGALPKVNSESEADPIPISEEQPLVSPEDDEFEMSGERRPVSPINDDEDEQSVTSSHFSDSDSDEETRGRGRRSSRDDDMSPPITFTTRVAAQTETAKATAERRRSQEGVTKGARRQATKSRSPLAIKSITRQGDTVIVTSPTHGTITITDAKVVEELDKSFADGQVTLSPIKRALSLSQDTQEAIEQAFEEKEILKLAANYKNDAKHTPPPVPERPGSPQFGLSSVAAEAEYEDNNPASQQAASLGLRAPAETGSLGHRRSASVEIAKHALQQSRYDLIHGDLRRLAIDPYHNVGRWNRVALWGFMRMQDNRVLSIAEALHKNNLTTDVGDMIDLQDERKYARTAVETIKSEYDRQVIAYEQRNAELETELASAEAENERLRAEQTLDSTREALLTSPTGHLSPEIKESLEKIEKQAEKINTLHETAFKGMDDLRSQLDIVQELQNNGDKLRDENQRLRDQLSQMNHQMVFFEKQEEKTELEIHEQKQTIDKLNRAYTVLGSENTQLKTWVQDLQNAVVQNEVEIAKLKVQLTECQSARPQKAKSNLKPVEESSTVIKIETECKTLGDSSPTLSGKVTALEKLLGQTTEERNKYKEWYTTANEQRVWSYAHYATLKEPWPIATREIMAQLIVSVVNANRKPIEKSIAPAEVAINGRSARDLKFELTGFVEDLPVSGTLTRDQVVQWLAAGMGIRAIFDEIRSLDLYIDKEVEQEILRVLIEQGLCYGNFDVFATFVFSDRLVSREEFVTRLNDVMHALDRLDRDVVTTETDLKQAEKKVAELEQSNFEQFVKITDQAHELNKAENALDAIEADRINPGGTLEKLLELRAEHEDLKARHAGLANEIAYYESELVQTRQDLDSADDALDNFTDKQSCTILRHRDLEARVQDLENQKQELAAAFNKNMIESESTPNAEELPFIPHNYWAELYRLREENEQHSRDIELEAAHMPNSPACAHCYNMRKKIIDLNKKLREAKSNAIPDSPLRFTPSGESADYCDNCMYLTMQLREARQRSRDFEDKLSVKKNQIRSCHYEIDKAQDDLAKANDEIQRLQSEVDSSSPKSTSTAPTSAGSSPANSPDSVELKKLKTLYAASQQNLAEKIAHSLRGDWVATKLAAPPADQEDELFNSFDTEGNARKLASENARLEKEVVTLQKNLDAFEAKASESENANAVVSLARIENFKRQVEQIPDLEKQISTLNEEKKNLIGLNNYLAGKKTPACCGVTREQLQKEIEAHAIAKKELEDAMNAVTTDDDDDDEDPFVDVNYKQEWQNCQKELSRSKSSMSRGYNDLVVQFAFSQKQLLAATRLLKIKRRELRPDEDTRPVDDNDPCKDVKEELAAIKLEHQDALDVIKDVSAENENNKNELRQARIDANKVRPALSVDKQADDKKADDKKADDKQPVVERVNWKKPIEKTPDEKKAERKEFVAKMAENKKATEHGNACTRHDDLIKQIGELESQIIKTRDHHLAQTKIEEQTQQLRAAAARIEELRFEVGKLQATAKVYRLAGDRHGPPANDDECKDAIKELIGEQTKLKDLIDNYKLDPPKKKSEPATQNKKEESKGLIKSTFNGVKSFFWHTEVPVTEPVVEAPKKEETPEPEPETDPKDDPCSIYKKHLKDVKKQVDAFEMLTLYKEKFLKEQEIVERKDKENMQVKNKIEIILKDAPKSLRKRLTQAEEANRKQANIIGCKEIVAAQQHKEMTALRKELEVLRKPHGPLNDLIDKNHKLQKEIDRVQGKFLTSQLKNSRNLNYLGREISVLYAERDKWRGTELTEGLWKPVDATKDRNIKALTGKFPRTAEAKTSKSAVKTSESPSRTTKSAPKIAEPTSKPVESATKTTEPASKAAVPKLGEDFRGTPENPWPRVTYDCWPQPSERLQKVYTRINDEMEYLYNHPTYVPRDRESSHPEADITGLWTEVQNTRWKLAEPEKLPLYKTVYKNFREYAGNEYFLPGFWLIIFLLDLFDYECYTVPTLDFIFGRENDPQDLAARWTPFIIIFFSLYTWWLQCFLRSIYVSEKSTDTVVEATPPESEEEDPCADVKKELEEVKAELEKTKEADKDKDKDKKDSDPCKDVKNELAAKAAKFDDLQAQLNGEKSVIDWENDKRRNSHWQRIKDTKFWEVAGIPGPRPVDAVTYDEFQKNGDLGASPGHWTGPSVYRTPAGMQSRVEYWPSPTSDSTAPPASNSTMPPPYEWIESTSIFASDKAALAAAWQEYLKRHPELEHYVRYLDPWNRDPATRESVNMALSLSQRWNLANTYGTTFPSHGELTAWRASQALLPPTDLELDEIESHHVRSLWQTPAPVRTGYAYTLPTSSDAGSSPGKPKAADSGRPFPHIPERLRHFKARAADYPAVVPVSDPCKDVKDKLAKSQTQVELWKHRQWKNEPVEVKKRCAEWYEEWRVKTILYDPVREQLTAVEDALEKEKAEHKTAKEELALADPKTIKTNQQQKADAVAQQKKLDAAQKEADEKLKAAGQETDKFKKRAEEFRKALESDKKARLNASTDEDDEVVVAVDKMSWLQFWIFLALSVPLSLTWYRHMVLDSMPMYKDSALSTTEILWYDTVESTRGHRAMIIITSLIIIALLTILGAWFASGELGVSLYPDFDDDNNDDNNDGNSGGNGDGDNSKGDGSDGKKKVPAKIVKLKGPLSFLMTGLPSSRLSPTFKRADKGYNHKNPMSWFPHGIAPPTPAPPKSPLGFKTTRQQTWKRSYISSVSIEPSAGTIAEVKPKEVSVYCKELEKRLEKTQQKLTMTERQPLAAKTKEAAFTHSGISSIDLRPQAGSNADQKRQTFGYSAISSVSSAPQVFEDGVKTVEREVESAASNGFGLWRKLSSFVPQSLSTTVGSITASTSDNSAEIKELKAELANANRQLEDARKEIDAIKGQSWWNTDESNEDSLDDPCKDVKKELERVTLELKQATDEIKWLRKKKAKEEEKKDGVDDNVEGDDDEDDDDPPPGSLELKFMLAEDMVKVRERQLQKAENDLKNCHDANTALRKRFYDASNGSVAEKKIVEDLKKAQDSAKTPKISTQPSPPANKQASSGDIDHSDCTKTIGNLRTKIDTLRDERAEADNKCRDAESRLRQLKEQGSTQDDTAKQDEIDKLNKKYESLDRDFERTAKKLKHYVHLYNTGADHSECLKGGKREILEQRILDFENNRDEYVTELEVKIKSLEASLKATKADEWKTFKELETARNQLSACVEAREQLKESTDVEGKVKNTNEEAESAKKELANWLNLVERNKTHVLQDESSDPEVAKLQRLLFEKNMMLEMAMDQQNQVKKDLQFYKNLLKQSQEAEDHNQCRKLFILYQQQAEDAEKERDEAAEINKKMWQNYLAEQAEADNAHEWRQAAEEKLQEAEKQMEAAAKKVQEAEKEKEELLEEIEDDLDSSIQEELSMTEQELGQAEESPSPGMCASPQDVTSKLTDKRWPLRHSRTQDEQPDSLKRKQEN
jgi:DNA repair exonuclease SbcCD ATPase subunit